LKDFGENDTEQNPKEFLMFLVKFLEKYKKLKPYQNRINDGDKIGNFLNKKFINSLEKGEECNDSVLCKSKEAKISVESLLLSGSFSLHGSSMLIEMIIITILALFQLI